MSLEKFEYVEGKGINFSKVYDPPEYLDSNTLERMEEVLGKSKVEELINELNILSQQFYNVFYELINDDKFKENYEFDGKHTFRYKKNDMKAESWFASPKRSASGLSHLINNERNITPKLLPDQLAWIKSDIIKEIALCKIRLNMVRETGAMSPLGDLEFIGPITDMSEEDVMARRRQLAKMRTAEASKHAAENDPFFNSLEAQMKGFDPYNPASEDPKKL